MDSKSLDRWFAAEAANDDQEAEAAFGALLASVPRLTPGAGFTERVLWAALPAPAPARRGFLAVWGWKVATLGALVLAGFSAALLPLARWLPVEAPSFGTVVKGWASALAWAAEWLDAGIAAWGFLARIGGALGTAAATPEIASALLATALVGGLALYSLNHLLAIERRTWR